MLWTILILGVGVILALGGMIELDRERFNHRPRMTYRAVSLIGAAMSVAALISL